MDEAERRDKARRHTERLKCLAQIEENVGMSCTR